MKVEFSISARRDLIAIFEHLQPLNARAARRIVDDLEKRCRSLSRFPRRGTPVLMRGDVLSAQTRRRAVPCFLRSAGPNSGYDAVLHGARDYEGLLEKRISAAKEE